MLSFMFIRIKSRKSGKYAYLVKNKWLKAKKYPKQKVIKYLGKVITIKKQSKLTLDITTTPFKESILGLLKTELINHSFKETNDEFIRDFIKINLQNKTITENSKLVSIELNEGFLNNYTLTELLNFKFNPKHPPLTQGHNLANLLISAGIRLSPSKFLKLFKKIHNP